MTIFFKPGDFEKFLLAVRRGRPFLFLKSLVRSIDNFFTRAKLRFAVPDSSRTLFVVHVGKSGGTFFRKSLRLSTTIKNDFSVVRIVHALKAPRHNKSQYLILLRDPIDRSLSAFNWRYSLVVVAGEPGRFVNEARVLNRYRSLSALAEELYVGNELNKSAVRAFNSVHHLREDISFHLRALYNQISPSQLYAVINQAHLNCEIKDVLGVDVESLPKQNTSSPCLPEQASLSDSARNNLLKFLEPEYQFLNWLAGLSRARNGS